MEIISRYRWAVLGSYMIVAAISQLLWLNFAPITVPIMTDLFSVSVQDVGLLSATWPLIFIFVSIPAGILTDKKGFKFSVSLGALIMALFSFLRILSGTDFTVLLIFQSLAGVGQPFVYTSISKMVVQWFNLKERGLATGLAIMAQFIGFISALIITPTLVPETNYNYFRNMLIIYSLVSLAGLIIFVLTAKERSSIDEGKASISFAVIKGVIKSKDFIILNALFFIGVGFFTGILTWLESILSSRGISVSSSDVIAAIMIVGGIIGSIIVPSISDKLSKRKPFFIINFGISAVMLYIISTSFNFTLLSISSFLLGFFLVSSLPIALDYSSRLVGADITGTVQSVLWLVAQAGSVILIPTIGYLADYTGFPNNPFLPSMILIITLDILCFILCFFIKES